MRVADRVSDVADRVQTRRLESKRETLDRDNERLRTELRTARDELERERSARDELLDAMKKRNGTVKADKIKVKKKKGGFLRLLLVGGGAYVLGTKAGRERYEQMRSWASDMRDKAKGSGSDDWTGGTSTSSSGTTGSSSTPSSGTAKGSTGA